MKRTTRRIMTGVILCMIILYGNIETGKEAKAEVRPEYMQDVPLDEVHFPDEYFRAELKRVLDENKDGILSRQEREKIYYLQLNETFGSSLHNRWYSDMKYLKYYKYDREDYLVYHSSKSRQTFELQGKTDINQACKILYKDAENWSDKIDLTGIEYFFNLQEVRADKYELLSGSFKNNVNLRKIWVGCTNLGDKGYHQVQKDFPVSQLTYMHLENIYANELDVDEIAGLQVLRVILPDESGRRLPALNLSKNVKLKELELANIMPAKLDLRKNVKLETVKVYSGKCKSGQDYGRNLKWKDYYKYYLPEKNMKCKITFAPKNNIQTLYYFTADKTIDISRLSKLEDFQTLKSVKAKVKSSWVRKTFKKKNWGCAVVKSGKFMKKIKAGKKKKYTAI